MKLQPLSEPRRIPCARPLLAALVLGFIAQAVQPVAAAGAASVLPGPIASPTGTPPDVQNLSLTVLSPASVSATADVVSDGGAAINWRGFVFSRVSPPILYDGYSDYETATGAAATGSMAATIASLEPGSEYFISGFAQNADGATGYSSVESIVMPCYTYAISSIENDASVGIPYNDYFEGAGGSGAHDFMLAEGSDLPPGMALDYYSGNLYGTPTTAGVYTFTITLVDSSYVNCGTSADFTIKVSALDVNPRSLKFPSEVVGQTSSAKAVVVGNYGGSDIALSSITAAAPFAISSNDCGPVLTAGTYCTLQITFAPSASTAYSGPLSIVNDAIPSPLLVPLRGAGTNTAVPQIYASNGESSTVSVIDPVTNFVRAAPYVGSGPGRPAVLPGGAKVYVPNYYSSTVAVIDGSTSGVSYVDAPFYYPASIATSPTGDEAWVLDLDGRISIVSTATDSVVTSFYTSPCVASYDSFVIVANHKTQDMYVISPDNDRVCVFNRISRTMTRSYSVPGSPFDGVVTPDGASLYLLREGVDLAKLNLGTGAIATVPGVRPDSIDIKPDGSKLYVSSVDGESPAVFGVVDTATNVFTEIPLGPDGVAESPANPGGVIVHPTAGRVYVADESADEVHVIDGSTDAEVTNPDTPIDDLSFAGLWDLGVMKFQPALGTLPKLSGIAALGYYVEADASTNVDDDGGSPIFERGFVYSTSNTDPQPGAPDVLAKVVGGGVGTLATHITGLQSGVTYYIRGYAKNVIGTGLSPVTSFTNAACSASSISPSESIAWGRVGQPYTQAFTASGPGGPYALSVTTPLPPGLNFSSGALSGTPTTAARTQIEVVSTEAVTNCASSASYDLVIGSNVSEHDVVISEFRTRGVNGAGDEYVELANRTSADIVVFSEDASGGWTIAQPGGGVASVPDGTVIPKLGHWLATGPSFSLGSFGVPASVGSGDWSMETDLVDDVGLALFETQNPGNFSLATRLDAVGSSLETDPLYREGGGLEPLGAVDPPAQSAWVRRTLDTGSLSDINDNSRDFFFVAADAGSSYGASGAFQAILGAPNPERTSSAAEVMNAQLPVSLVEPERGPNQSPNRRVSAFYSIEYRRSFTNLTGKPIRSLLFKITNLTTSGSRPTIANQADLRVTDAGGAGLETSAGNVFALGTTIESPSMYSLFECCWQPYGGLNTVVSAFGGGSEGGGQEITTGALKPCGSTEVLEGEKVAVNLRVRILNPGYYLFVVIPQVSEFSRGIIVSEEGLSAPSACGPPSLRDGSSTSGR